MFCHPTLQINYENVATGVFRHPHIPKTAMIFFRRNLKQKYYISTMAIFTFSLKHSTYSLATFSSTLKHGKMNSSFILTLL
uniref:Uncharacterized protein n=1 Tax=Pyxicephalus adspersus TaxID=30357 RepID=A0AAV2ZWV7_PYXAD|nr:TPA: hypothetical protein GDO54_014024 [Pyxicephalus adspersus]